MSNTVEIQKLSVWYSGPTKTLTNPAAHLYDKRDHYKCKIRKTDVLDMDTPIDLTDWCVTVTDVSGEHYHGEITAYDVRGHHYVYKWPKRGAIVSLP